MERQSEREDEGREAERENEGIEGIEERAPQGAGAEAPATTPTAGGMEPAERGPLLPSEDLGGFRTRWEEIQVRFVDEPRGAVQQADALVEELARRLTDSFARERGELESRWDRGDEVSTEDLRVALQRYRSFFDRLLAA
jgi:hypothetical protein